MEETGTKHRGGRGRKRRASNACTRCRQHKIRCSGSHPCETCSRRNIVCRFEHAEATLSVSHAYIDRLKRELAELRRRSAQEGDGDEDPTTPITEPDSSAAITTERRDGSNQSNQREMSTAFHTDEAAVDQERSRANDAVRADVDTQIQNPLVNDDDSPSLTFDTAGRSFMYIMPADIPVIMLRGQCKMCWITRDTLPVSNLLFEGLAYDLGWDGRRPSSIIDTPVIPTADFALFLINAVKFHCGQLYHLFDEEEFMHHFGAFYERSRKPDKENILWYVHFLLLLALGSAFTARTGNGRKPPGVEFFRQAQQLLPDVTCLYTNPTQTMEVCCCASIYLQSVDKRRAAYSMIGQALRVATEQGMHTDMLMHPFSGGMVERCRRAWWTTYMLDCQMSSLIGAPVAIADDGISALLPSFGGSRHKSSALKVQLKLSRATAFILRTVYGKRGAILESMKAALCTLADANDERNEKFPLDLQHKTGGICRLSAHLHLLHHQCLILATRPLLFSFWKIRLASAQCLHVSSSHGARSLLSICVGSAQQSLNNLQALHDQNLLETFLPFDREATYNSAVQLSIARVIDPTLVHKPEHFIKIAHTLLDEMAARGNLVAAFHKRELLQLEENISRLPVSENGHWEQLSDVRDWNMPVDLIDGLTELSPDGLFASGSNIGDGPTGEQLLGLADSLDMEDFSWLNVDGFADVDRGQLTGMDLP